MGYQNDVRPFLVASDALVFPSYREGFPNVVIQAGAMGLPAIVTDINGCNEIVLPDLNGVIIPSKDEQALYESMKYFASHPVEVERMAANARPLIASRYFIIVFCVLVVIWPILLIITLWLHFANKGAGAFFAQERPGKGGKVFKVIKFKTMTDERDADGNLLPDADRLTNVGRFVRSTSIDELPQLINVLKGDMALIGPRPLLVQYLPLYSKEQARRHDVRPGITGWAQVNGRNAISWTKKFELDVWYVDHCSFWLDVKIIFLTIKKVFVREGISQEGQATMEFFTGNN